MTGTVSVSVGDIDWPVLVDRATEAAQHAYAPYSRLRVGAAAVVDDGRVVIGCNVENASYGLALCAECALVGQLHLSGGGRLVALVAVDGDGTVLSPCGRCRQLLMEHGGPELAVLGIGGVKPMSELLPDSFGSVHLPTQ